MQGGVSLNRHCSGAAPAALPSYGRAVHSASSFMPPLCVSFVTRRAKQTGRHTHDFTTSRLGTTARRAARPRPEDVSCSKRRFPARAVSQCDEVSFIPGQVSTLSVSHTICTLYCAVLWARRAFTSPKRRFSARAVSQCGEVTFMPPPYISFVTHHTTKQIYYV